MTDLDWVQLRNLTIDRFQGQAPRREDEDLIIGIYETHPQLVTRAIDETAAALADGKITWAWSILRTRLERGTTAIRNAKPDTTGDINRRIENAKRWIDNAGIHHDLQRHIEAELFGDEYGKGRLTELNLTPAQKAELIDYWKANRPRGIAAERAALEWAAKMLRRHPRQTQSSRP